MRQAEIDPPSFSPVSVILAAIGVACGTIASLFLQAHSLSFGIFVPISLVIGPSVALLVVLPDASDKHVLRAIGGGLLGGAISGVLLWVQKPEGIGTLLIAPVGGAIWGIFVGPIVALVELPLLLACLRARRSKSTESTYAVTTIAAIWMFVVAAVCMSISADLRRSKYAYVPPAIAIGSLFAVFASLRAVRAKLDLLARISAGKEAGLAIVPATEVTDTGDALPLVRASAHPQERDYDAFIVARGESRYRTADTELIAARVSSNEAGSAFGVVLRYLASPRWSRGNLTTIVVLFVLFAVLGAIMALLVLRR